MKLRLTFIIGILMTFFGFSYLMQIDVKLFWAVLGASGGMSLILASVVDDKKNK